MLHIESITNGGTFSTLNLDRKNNFIQPPIKSLESLNLDFKDWKEILQNFDNFFDTGNSGKFASFRANFIIFRRDLDEHLSEFHENSKHFFPADMKYPKTFKVN